MSGVQSAPEASKPSSENAAKVSADASSEVKQSFPAPAGASDSAAPSDTAAHPAGASNSESEPKKAAAKAPPVRLAPAPVPTSSPWKATVRDAKPVQIPAAAALETSRKESKKEPAPKDRPKKNTGKEKWMPYTPVVITTPPGGTSGQSKPKQKSRSKQGGNRKHGNHSNHHHNNNNNGNAAQANGNASGSSSAHASASSNTDGASQSQSNAQNASKQNSTSNNSASNNGSAGQHHHRSHNNQGNSHNSNYRRGNQNKKDNDSHAKQVYQQAPVAASPYDIALGMLVQQMEYYFSIENLCKDIYLRRQMNSKGLVPISVLANFNRVRSLSKGDLNLVVMACRWAPSAEVVGEKVRLRKDWSQWVLPPNERLDQGLNEADDEEEDAPKFQVESAVPFIPKSR